MLLPPEPDPEPEAEAEPVPKPESIAESGAEEMEAGIADSCAA